MKRSNRRRKTFKKLYVEQLTIEKLSHEGRGVARHDGKTIFVQGALPGEVVDISIINAKKDYCDAVVEKVHTASELRVDPQCPHFEMCGGCSLQHMAADKQIVFKEGVLHELMEKLAHVKPQEGLPTLRASTWGYRTKARLSVRYVAGKNGFLVGFREKNNGRYIADLKECHILVEKVGFGLIELRSLLDSFEQKECIAQIEIAAGEDSLGLIFRNLMPLTELETKLLRDFQTRFDCRVFLQPGGYDTIVPIDDNQRIPLFRYALPDYNVTLQFHPSDFTQVNLAMNRLMVAKAIEHLALAPEDKVLDLFCGLGNFSIPLATQAAEVIGIEGSKDMVERAQMNAGYNGIENVRFAVRDLFNENPLTKAELEGVHKALIDPPRSGAYEVVQQLAMSGMRKIVYISCNPATLARDTDCLVNQHGYTLQKAGVMDMFPHTTHVESIAVFEKVA